MRAIIFDTELSSLIFEDEVNTLRLCYLIADSVCVGGQAGACFNFESKAKKFNLLKKVGYLHSIESRGNYDNKEANLASIIDFIAVTKEVKAFKHPPQNLLVAINSAGKVFSDCFGEYVENLLAIWKTKGYLDIISLKEDDSIIETILTEFSVGEWTQTLKSASLNAKKILGLLSPESATKPSLLVFPKEFLINRDNETTDLIDEHQIMTTFSFPDTASLTGLQLKSIREQLKESGQLFRENMDNWMLNLNGKTQDNDFNHLEETLKIFQKGINSNQMLLDNQNRIHLDAVSFTIKIGVTSLQSVWNYYRKCKVLDDFTIEELIKQTCHNSSYPQNLPFLCILPNYINKEKMEELNKLSDEGFAIQHKKKYIEL